MLVLIGLVKTELLDEPLLEVAMPISQTLVLITYRSQFVSIPTHNPSNMQRNYKPGPSHTHSHHCECHCDVTPTLPRPIAVTTGFVFVIVYLQLLYTRHK